MKSSSLEIQIEWETIVNKVYGNLKTARKILLFCHGFPGTNRLPNLATSVQGDDLAIVEASYRGDKGSDGTFSFFGSIKDIEATARHIRSINGNALLWALGYSTGGFYVLNAIREAPKLFDEIILLCPIVYPNEMFSNEALMQEYWSLAENILSLQSPSSYTAEIEKINEGFDPMKFADKLITPMHIIQSSEDDVISLQTVKTFFNSLTCKKEFIEIPGLNHFPKGDEAQLINVSFFSR